MKEDTWLPHVLLTSCRFPVQPFMSDFKCVECVEIKIHPVSLQGHKTCDTMQEKNELHLWQQTCSYLSGLRVDEMQHSLSSADHHQLFIWVHNQTGRLGREGRHQLAAMKRRRSST